MKTKQMIYCGLFAALTAVFSQIALPLPFTPVVINLATLSVFTAGCVLGFKYGTLSQLIYVLIGIAGMPVFSKFRGGAAHIVGATGGYITGYIVCAAICGILSDKVCKKPIHYSAAMAAGLVACYILGTVQYICVTKISAAAAAAACVLPFIPGDILKIAVATAATVRIKKAVTLT